MKYTKFVEIHQPNPHKELQEKVKELLKLIDHNTTSLWCDNLKYTADCIVLEDINSKNMRNEEIYETMKEDETYNEEHLDNKEKESYQFTGDELNNLIEEIKKYI